MPKSLISIDDFSKDELLHVLKVSKEFENNREQDFLRGKVVACLFFEPSTRTRLSFEAAVNRLGARVIGFPDNKNTSQSKGESLVDTIRIISSYVDLIVMRHPMEGAAALAAEVSPVPVINAGDGANQHPTQTLLDLYSIQKTQGRLDGLTVDMVGDLRYGRTVHSLTQALSNFDVNFVFTSPDELRMPRKYLAALKDKGIPYTETESLDEHLPATDILYMTRVQQERFPSKEDYDRVKDTYILTASMLQNVRPNFKVLHPLPRINEIATDVDSTPYAYYFQQAAGGMYVRMGVISYLLGYR